MEQEILFTLEQIRGYLFGFIVIFFGFFAVVFFHGIAQIFRALLDGFSGKDFKAQADLLFKRKDCKGVVDLCNDVLKDNETDSDAIWWLAKALYGDEQYAESKFHFEQLIIREPEWRGEFIRPYLDVISELERGEIKKEPMPNKK